MSAPAPAPAPASESRREVVSFFRQSGWMFLANGLAGVFFTLVHSPAGRIARVAGVGKAEYATFGALLDSMILMGIPVGGLQAVFAQLASGAIDAPRQNQLRATVRTVLTLVVALWTLAAVGVWIGRAPILSAFQITNPWALAFTLLTLLVGLVFPVFAGLLQGGQRFFWMGNAAIASGAGRLVGVTAMVVVCGYLAAGAMAGVMLGASAALALAAWASRDMWWGPASSAQDWSWVRAWFALTVGMAAGSVMLGADPFFVQSTFNEDEKAFYVAAGRVGRGLVASTMPLAMVLFPRAARSAATGQPTGALKLALGATLGTGVAAALVCTVAPEFPIRVLYFRNPVFLPAAELVPLFCWCMLPLTAAYTLVNNLLARRRFAAVPWLLVVAAGYALTLASMREGMIQRASPLLQAGEVTAAFVERLRQPRTDLDSNVQAGLPLEVRDALTEGLTNGLPQDDLQSRLREALNLRISRDSLHAPDRFANVTLRAETRNLLARDPAVRDQPRLNRLLLEDAYPDGLVRKQERRLFDEFRRVIRTLGFFSLLLLAVSIVFSLRRDGEGKAGIRA